MAEPPAAVTDTHALVFHAAGGGKLGPRAGAIFARCERREAIIYVPAVVMWECSLLARVSRIDVDDSSDVLPDQIVDLRVAPEAVDPEPARAAFHNE